VAFRVADGATAAAARLGDAVNAAGDIRRFRVRRMPPFVRWLLSFAGDAIPVGPPALVSAFRACAGETLALYREAADVQRQPRGHERAPARRKRR
jgi:hypothetical protein